MVIGIIRRRGKDGEKSEEDEKSFGEVVNKWEEMVEMVVIIVVLLLESYGKVYYVWCC